MYRCSKSYTVLLVFGAVFGPAYTARSILGDPMQLVFGSGAMAGFEDFNGGNERYQDLLTRQV